MFGIFAIIRVRNSLANIVQNQYFGNLLFRTNNAVSMFEDCDDVSNKEQMKTEKCEYLKIVVKITERQKHVNVYTTQANNIDLDKNRNIDNIHGYKGDNLPLLWFLIRFAIFMSESRHFFVKYHVGLSTL